MSQTITMQEVQAAATFILAHTPLRPQIAITLGSGLSPLADEIDEGTIIPYREIPNFPVPTVEGHAGQLVIGKLAGATLAAMQGRFHYYEGYDMAQVTLPVRVMRALGVRILVLTNAAGGINPGFQRGDLMLITDHINLMGMAGVSGLRGPNDPNLGARFPSMVHAYDRELRLLALNAADEAGLRLRQGVYAYLGGPSFETPAEIRFLRTIGADAVGMSTVPETVVAVHGGLRVLAISTISNVAIDQIDSAAETTHDEVLETGLAVGPRLATLLRGILGHLHNSLNQAPQ